MCWKKVEEEFNEHDKDFKDWQSLKIKYNNLKRKTKLKFSENKLNITQTGGGPYREVKIDPVNLAIKDIIGPQLDGFSNIYDNDADERIEEPEKMIQIVVNENTNLENMAIDDENINLECVASDDNDAAQEKDNVNQKDCHDGADNRNCWAKYTPQTLRTPVTRKLKARRLKTNTGGTKYVGIQYQLMQEKLEFVKLQKEKYLEEHIFKMEILRKKNILLEKQLSSMT
ncbi:unnamed protein product [Callosobruchus maculatus]|nr:unnamed protein product [Callosobruchus maculatus]